MPSRLPHKMELSTLYGLCSSWAGLLVLAGVMAAGPSCLPIAATSPSFWLAGSVSFLSALRPRWIGEEISCGSRLFVMSAMTFAKRLTRRLARSWRLCSPMMPISKAEPNPRWRAAQDWRAKEVYLRLSVGSKMLLSRYSRCCSSLRKPPPYSPGSRRKSA